MDEMSNPSTNFFAMSTFGIALPGFGVSPSLFLNASSICDLPNRFKSLVEIVSNPNNPSNSISARKVRLESDNSSVSNSFMITSSGLLDFTCEIIFFSAKIFGFENDFTSHFSKIFPKTSCTEFV